MREDKSKQMNVRAIARGRMLIKLKPQGQDLNIKVKKL